MSTWKSCFESTRLRVTLAEVRAESRVVPARARKGSRSGRRIRPRPPSFISARSQLTTPMAKAPWVSEMDRFEKTINPKRERKVSFLRGEREWI